MKDRFGTFILFGALLLVLCKPGEPEPPLVLEFDRDRVRSLGVILNVASEEMIAAADSENIEEHVIERSERVFDDFAREADFIGPDFITRPLARKAVRPVVKTVLRYLDKKALERTIQEEEFCHE